MPTSLPAKTGTRSVTPAIARFTVRLGDAREGDRDLGGKAASLDRLSRLGRPIPPGFCVSAAAYRAWFDSVEDPNAVAAAVARLPDEDARLAVTEALEATTTPAGVRAAVDEALVAVASEMGQPAAETLLAVRSSALDEDSAAASFAGVHETELGRLPADVEPAMRRCWLSLWSRTAVAYRARRGLTFDGVAMAVVVQALVPAELSAVVFTRHPVTGRDDVLINAIRGLGEPMVSGTATPETIVVDRARRHVTERIPGDRGERLFVLDGAVTRRRDDGTGPVLTDAGAVELAEVALDIEHQLGAPVDIEAVRADGRWLLLQARPITT